MIVILVLGALMALLAWVTVFAITDAWRQAAKVCDAIIAGANPSDAKRSKSRSVIGDDVIADSGEPECWTALDDYQLARFVNDTSSR